MKKTIIRILIIFIFALLISNISFCSKVFALNGIDDIFQAGKDFIAEGNISPEQDEKLQPLSQMVSNVLLTVAIGVTVISSVVMGINFLIQSVEEKAKIKESMIPWIIGVLVSFGAYGIWSITMNVFYQLDL